MSMPMRSRLLRAVAVLFVLGGLVVLVSCEGPGGQVIQPEPPLPYFWQGLLDQGKYDRLIEQTGPIINAGEGAEFYPDARLFRGLAELGMGGDLQAARADLDAAEGLIDHVSTIGERQARLLLFRGQMVVRAKLGEFEAAERYRDRALELAPDQQNDILGEFEHATR